MTTNQIDSFRDSDQPQMECLHLLSCNFGNFSFPHHNIRSVISETDLTRGFLEVITKEVTFKKFTRLLWYRNGKCGKGVEGDALMLAGRAYYFGLVLTSHEISDDWLIIFDVFQPVLSSCLSIDTYRTVNSLFIGLLFNTVQVFMQSVNEEGKKFLWVLLGLPSKNWVYLAYYIFDFFGRVNRIPFAPHCFDEHGIAPS